MIVLRKGKVDIAFKHARSKARSPDIPKTQLKPNL
jgi:hypothetical protein